MLAGAIGPLQERAKAAVPSGRKVIDCERLNPDKAAPVAVTVPSAAIARTPRLVELLFATSASRPFGLAATLIGPKPLDDTPPVSVRTPAAEMLKVSTTALLKALASTLLPAVTATPCKVTGRLRVLAIVLVVTLIATIVVEPPPSVTSTNFPSGVNATASAAIGVVTDPMITGG